MKNTTVILADLLFGKIIHSRIISLPLENSASIEVRTLNPCTKDISRFVFVFGALSTGIINSTGFWLVEDARVARTDSFRSLFEHTVRFGLYLIRGGITLVFINSCCFRNMLTTEKLQNRTKTLNYK